MPPTKLFFLCELANTDKRAMSVRAQPETGRTGILLIILLFPFLTPDSFFTVQRKAEKETRDNICFLHCPDTQLITPRYARSCISRDAPLPSDDTETKMALLS